MIYFGIDLGEKKIGVAKGRGLNEPIFPLWVFVRKKLRFVVSEILKEANGEKFGLVFGLPIEENGVIGLQGRKILKVVRKFLEEVRAAREASRPHLKGMLEKRERVEVDKKEDQEKDENMIQEEIWFIDESFSSFEALELKKEMLRMEILVGEDDAIAAMKILERFFKGVGIINDVSID